MHVSWAFDKGYIYIYIYIEREREREREREFSSVAGFFDLVKPIMYVRESRCFPVKLCPWTPHAIFSYVVGVRDIQLNVGFMTLFKVRTWFSSLNGV
jgi:hypothetical protein